MSDSTVSKRELEDRPRRLGLWQIEAGALCSILGTCLSIDDLRAALRTHRISFDSESNDYEVHGYCVRTVKTDCPLSRTLTKVLNHRFSGAVNLITKARSPEDVVVVWKRLSDSGRIAAGYWAIMSHRDVTDDVKMQIFGEVHMLSHLHGRSVHQLSIRLADAERQCVDLKNRLARNEANHQAAMAERDAARKVMFEQQMNFRRTHAVQAAEGPFDGTLVRLRAKLTQRERALMIARARARQAEAELARIKDESQVPRVKSVASARHTTEPQASKDIKLVNGLAGQRILYIGGRNTLVPHLRSVAEAYAAEFHHHDGGVEHSMHRIADVIHSCDAVVCPVDCVSHCAYQIAKTACQRLNKTFLPIPAASRFGFEQALLRLSGFLSETAVPAP